jgi:hypothetical protein
MESPLFLWGRLGGAANTQNYLTQPLVVYEQMDLRRKFTGFNQVQLTAKVVYPRRNLLDFVDSELRTEAAIVASASGNANN